MPEERLVSHHNNLGFLRLLFATLVIVSHGPELVGGNQSREIFHRIFGSTSFGAVAVDGFFLISGYLITKSFVSPPSSTAYLRKRVVRIYPGFLAASLLSLAIAPLFLGNLSAIPLRSHVVNLIMLAPPLAVGVFPGNYYQHANGALWTIPYEFRCYVLVMILGLCGLLVRRKLILGSAAVLLALYCLPLPTLVLPSIVEKLVGMPIQAIRLTGVFLVGMSFFLYRDRIRYEGKIAAIVGTALLPMLFIKPIGEVVWVVLGGYLVFWFAFALRSRRLSAIGAPQDFSYGTYLYAWPIQSAIVWRWPWLLPWIVVIATIVLVIPFSIFSWFAVEMPALNLLKRAASD